MIATDNLAPDFTLPRTDGRDLTLSALRPGGVVLYFYPRDDTPGCTREALEFTALAHDFEAAGVAVLGISRDSIAKHGKFTAKHGLSVELLSDADGAVCAAYGVWVEKTLYGRTSMGIQRATFLIAGDGRVARVWPKVRVAGHAAEVLQMARAI